MWILCPSTPSFCFIILFLPLISYFFLNVVFTQWLQQTSRKFAFQLSLLGYSSFMVWLCVYCSSVVLQAPPVCPGFSNLVQEPDCFMTQVLHAWLTCQLQVSRAHPDWFSLSVSSLASCCHPGLREQPVLDWSAILYRCVCTDIYRGGGRGNVRLRKEDGNTEWGGGWGTRWWPDEMSGYWQAG